jgi:hypothetical protein
MADQTPTPVLPSTADPIPYVPVSWMAVAAATVASLFVAVLLILGVSGFVNKKPLIMPELLVFPVIGVVLSFAARRMIRNSEGTRTGENLANTAWWMSLVGGLGYTAYLMAIDYSVRRDAQGEVNRWVENIIREDPSDESFNLAFMRTMDPGRRASLDPRDTAKLRALFPDQYLMFEQCDLVRVARRNRGDGVCKFEPGGLRDWMYRPSGIDCVFTGTLKCPEGSFPVNVPLRGTDPPPGTEAAGRQWGIFVPSNGFIAAENVTRTRYGWLVRTLERSGGQFGGEFITAASNGPAAVPYVYQVMARPDSDREHWKRLLDSAWARLAVAGGPGFVLPPYTKEYADNVPENLFKLPGRGTPNNDQKKEFMKVWSTQGLIPPGGRVKGSPDTAPTIGVTETAIEVRVPCELPMVTSDGFPSAARGRVVVVCTDRGVIEELKRLRAEARPEEGTAFMPEEFRTRDFKWRVDRVESDLSPVPMAMPRPGEGAGPPGGPPGPGGTGVAQP